MTSASSDVDFDDYGVFGYQLEPEYTEEELRQMEEAASAQCREIYFSCIFRSERPYFNLKYCILQ